MTSPRLHLHLADQERARRAGRHAEAFRRFVADYHACAYDLAYRTLDDREDAEEVVQDAFVRIHGALADFRGDASLKTWVLRIVWRLSLNRRRDGARSAWRRLGLHRSPQDPDAAQATRTPEDHHLSREMRHQVRTLIEDLSPPLREVLVLNSFEDLGYAQIARILDIPVGTVSSRIHAARRRLAQQLRRAGLA